MDALVTEDPTAASASSEASVDSPALESLPLEPPRRPFSVMRVLIALLLLAGLVGAGALALAGGGGSRTTVVSAPPTFAPYVDATLTPSYPFQDPGASPVRSVVLGFVVSAPGAPCRPSWGGAYTLDAASTAIDLDRRIAQAQAQGGNVMVSFGGAANGELAVGCTDESSLVAAYQGVVRRYHVAAIDLDVEGAAIADAAATARRAQAIAAVQRGVLATGGRLAVWLTLPVAVGGLTAEGLAQLHAMLAAHVALAGVNVLAMDYGAGAPPARGLLTTIERSAAAAREQVARAYAAVRVTPAAASGWNRIGVTVMIGQNDVPSERFTLADASGLARFAALHGIARVSMWSINRDAPCPAYPGVAVLSNTCSGVAQSPLQFSRLLAHAGGRAGAAAALVVGSTAVAPTAAADDPATSPYPIWSPNAPYATGYKVVWHRQVYEAKWFSEAQAPDQPPADGSPSSWALLGPVLPGEHRPAYVRLAGGTYPAWSAAGAYRIGARVLYHGLPYEAKWYTRGDLPDGSLSDPQQSPWAPLFGYAGEPR